MFVANKFVISFASCSITMNKYKILLNNKTNKKVKKSKKAQNKKVLKKRPFLVLFFTSN